MAQPNFASIPVNATISFNTANNHRDGTGDLFTLITAPTNGVIIHDIRINAIANSTAGMIRFYLCDGTNNNIILEHPVSAVSATATNPAWQTSLTDLNWILQEGWSIKLSTEKGETFKASITRAGAM